MANITLHGGAVHTVGSLPEVGSTIKQFALIDGELKQKTNSDFSAKRVILNIFPSIDTGVCAAAARKFNEEASTLKNTVVINVSKDLPLSLIHI